MLLEMGFLLVLIVCVSVLVYSRYEKYDSDSSDSLKWHQRKYIDSNRIRRPKGLRNNDL